MTGKVKPAGRLLREAGLSAKKSWGQNFLRDRTTLAFIADATGCGPEHPVVELGAGLGALTVELLARGGRVLAVERDRDLVPVLRRELPSDRLEVLEADAARLDYAGLAARLGGALIVAGNLPYQIASRIIVSLADAAPAVERAVVLVQREVGQRLAASPGGRTYGLLSVLVQRVFTVELLRPVPPGAFHPQPKVHSVVVRLSRLGQGFGAETDRLLVAAARAAFGTRRKTLRNALAAGLGAEPAQVESAVAAAGLDPGARAESLSVAQFACLGDALARAGLVT